MPYTDPEKRRAHGREWMKRNPEKARAGMRRWGQRHPEVHAARTRARYARDPKRFQERTDASPNRPAVRRAMHQRRRARFLGAGPSFTATEWMALVELYGNRCALMTEDEFRARLAAERDAGLTRPTVESSDQSPLAG
jgi:hypothetical protein